MRVEICCDVKGCESRHETQLGGTIHHHQHQIERQILPVGWSIRIIRELEPIKDAGGGQELIRRSPLLTKRERARMGP
jgi:hypothetical protein